MMSLVEMFVQLWVTITKSLEILSCYFLLESIDTKEPEVCLPLGYVSPFPPLSLHSVVFHMLAIVCTVCHLAPHMPFWFLCSYIHNILHLLSRLPGFIWLQHEDT